MAELDGFDSFDDTSSEGMDVSTDIPADVPDISADTEGITLEDISAEIPEETTETDEITLDDVPEEMPENVTETDEITLDDVPAEIPEKTAETDEIMLDDLPAETTEATDAAPEDLSGTSVRLDGHKYYLDSNGEQYRVDDSLEPGTSYELNGYHFETDDMGRISWVEGDLSLRDRDRLSIRDSISDIGKGDEEETDDRGHIVADLFNGPNGLENMFPQNYAVNRGSYKALEAELAKAVDKGDDVRANYELAYSGDSFRPDEVVVTYIINDQIYERRFPN